MISGYFQEYIEDVDMDQFGLWAFGEGVHELTDSMQFLEAWNHLHGNDLTLNPADYISDGAPKMVELWREKTKL